MDIVDIVHSKAQQGTHPVFGCAIVPSAERELRR
jgi:hypothetical protein